MSDRLPVSLLSVFFAFCPGSREGCSLPAIDFSARGGILSGLNCAGAGKEEILRATLGCRCRFGLQVNLMFSGDCVY